MINVLMIHGPLKGQVISIPQGSLSYEFQSRGVITYDITEFSYRGIKFMMGYCRGTHKLNEDGSKHCLSPQEIFEFYELSDYFSLKDIKAAKVGT